MSFWKRWDLIGYLLLLISSVTLDQSTKLHAQKSLMTWYDESELRSYRADSVLVGHLGVSPSTRRDLELPEESQNWLDFRLTYVRNPGAAWGSFGNVPQKFRLPIFYAITAVVSVALIYMFRTSKVNQRLNRTALVLVMGGAMGNFIDRVMLQYVIDWIHFHWKIGGWEYSFPVFNWADVSINVGIGLMILDMLLVSLAEKRMAKHA